MSEAWPQFTTEAEAVADAAKRFADNISDHRVTVVVDADGVTYLRARRPGDNTYWFDVTATPTHVTIAGDMGAYVFTRYGTSDQLSLFRSHVNVSYWSQKCTAGDAKRFSLDAYRQTVIEAAEDHIAELIADADLVDAADGDELTADLVKAYREQVIGELLPAWLEDDDPTQAYQRLYDSTVDGCRFEGGDVDLERPTFRFLWCLHALAWAVARYDELATPNASSQAA